MQDSIGWWYRNADQTYPANTWQMIDGSWYYLDESEKMLHDTTTPDGYRLDASGLWAR